MSQDSPTAKDGAAVRIPPPIVFLVAILLGGLLQAYVFRFMLPIASVVRRPATIVAALVGIAIIVAAMRLFRRTGQEPEPWKSTPEIISDGIYRFTRTPMYVGMALIQTAIGLGRSNGWILALIPFSLVVVYWTAIRHEEAYLARKFGQPYLDYVNSVRRWL